MSSGDGISTLLVGISGPSSSGKTTLSRLLRDIIPGSFILHEDDFYKADKDIPVREQDGIADWDCLDALDLPALQNALDHIKQRGSLPPELISKEDQNSVGNVNVDPEVVAKLKTLWTSEHGSAAIPRIAIVDGFLLFGKDMVGIRSSFDVKLFLRAEYDTVKRRREARKGYVTIEGFWEDPPKYVDKVVWPNYVSDHRYLFVDGNVEGEVNETVRKAIGINVMPHEAREDMSACLRWAYDTIETAISGR